MKTKIISISNQKGGVGKTTTAVNLSTALAACGTKVLLIDFDPQGNASTGLGVKVEDREKNSYRILTNEYSACDTIRNTIVLNLDIIPSKIDLSGAEIELSNLDRREYILKNKLSNLDGKYDYIIIDCPPSLGLLTINALSASGSLIIPLQCEFYALEGLAQLMNTVTLVKQKINQSLELQGIVLTMYDSRNKLSEMVEIDVRTHFGPQVYNTVIPRNVRMSEAPSFGKPVLMYDLKCPGAQAYVSLAAEILKQETKS